MQEVKAKADQYRRRAEEFAQKAETARDAQGQSFYRNMAESYRLLSRRVFALSAASDDEVEAFARRIVEK